jgi:alpha-mannosidase
VEEFEMKQLSIKNAAVWCVCLGAAIASVAGYDLAKDKVCYIVGYAHLDTQWQWTIEDVVATYLPNTFRQNFALFKKYPQYRFSFEGAYRYMLLKKHYPDLYAGSLMRAMSISLHPKRSFTARCMPRSSMKMNSENAP